MAYGRFSLYLGLSFDLLQVALHLRLHVIELVGRVTSFVALQVGTRHQIRPAVELLAVLVDHLEIEFVGGGQAPSFPTIGRLDRRG